jgi:hypothetical protein
MKLGCAEKNNDGEEKMKKERKQTRGGSPQGRS